LIPVLERTFEATAGWLTTDRLLAGTGALLLLLVGWVLARAGSALVGRIAEGKATPQGAMLLRRFTYYGIGGLAVASALRELGFDLSVLLGAAGILTVAVGFASQTSASNLISGLFLLGERPFVVGDAIAVGTTVGEVVSIDLMSVKLRTFDNLLVRIPNENLLKSEIRNLTHFPIRRFDLRLSLPHDCDLARARAVLLAAATADHRCLDEPCPMVLFAEFGPSGLVLELRAWTSTSTYLEFRNALPDRLKLALEEAGIPIALPRQLVTLSSP
jgi:small-conductance mechanosensitive channel